LAAAIARGARQRLPPALLPLDVEHFKPINDILGHAAGDEFAAKLIEPMQQSFDIGGTSRPGPASINPGVALPRGSWMPRS